MTTDSTAPTRSIRLRRGPSPIDPTADSHTGTETAVSASATVAALMTPALVADLLATTTKNLERWRSEGGGPRYVRLSKKTIRYRADDVEAFIASRVRASTASG